VKNKQHSFLENQKDIIDSETIMGRVRAGKEKTYPLEDVIKEFDNDCISANNNGDNCVSIDEESEYIDIFETDWYKALEAEETPGGNLRFYRKLVKMTQSELAEKLGIVKQNVSNMENGKRTISKDMAKKLAKIFRTSPARFI